jgi:hypothetical protein
MRRLGPLALAALLAGCFGGLPADGALKCGRNAARACPKGMYCAGDGTCWRTGHAPAPVDAALDDAGQTGGDDAATDDGGPTGGDDGAGAPGLGTPCSDVSTCPSGHCVDGVCCDAACDGQCQACDLEGKVGTCATVSTGPPHGTRPACTGGDTTCGGACTGSSPTSCTYPDAKTGCGAACDGLCDGAGHCSSNSTGSCPGGFACGIGGCKTSCSFDSDCQPRFRCDTGGCMRIPESDCLDGLDNNGDGLTDCQDPTCSDRAACVPGAPMGDTAGVFASGACPLNFKNAIVENQGLNAPACDGCYCRASTACSITVYFDTTSCMPSGTTVGVTSTATSDGQGGTVGCSTVAAQSPPSIDVSAASHVSTTCAAVGSPAVPAKSWTLTRNFCAAERSSHTCGASGTCVAKPQPGAAICLRIPGAGAMCPEGYTGGTVSTWYGDASDNRTCTNCGCGSALSNGDCNYYSQSVLTDSTASCPIGAGTSGSQVGYCSGTIATPIGAVQYTPYVSWGNVCNLSYTSSGAATPISPATICCPTCSCVTKPCISLACPSANFCDGSACQACDTPKFCGAACLDCTAMKADTCTAGACRCGTSVCTTRSDSCVGGTCKCGASPECTIAQGTSCQGGVCKCGNNPGCDGVLGKCSGTGNTASCRCGASPACDPKVADACVGTVCRCGANAKCNPALADNCTGGACHCGNGPVCNGTTAFCTSGSCMCGSNPACTLPQKCTLGIGGTYTCK